MDLRIGEIAEQKLQPPGQIAKDTLPGVAEDIGSFADYLADAIGNVDSSIKEAQDIGMAFALGEPIEVHDIMLAFSKAELSLRLFIELRNKVIEAYQEIMRMPV